MNTSVLQVEMDPSQGINTPTETNVHLASHQPHAPTLSKYFRSFAVRSLVLPRLEGMTSVFICGQRHRMGCAVCLWLIGLSEGI